MKTAFVKRCEDAWRRRPEIELELSIRTHLWDEHDTVDPTFVYVVHDAVEDAIKIGISRAPRNRFSGIQTSTARPLELVTYAPCYKSLERWLHGLLADSRLTGEWFRVTDRSLVLCEMLLSAADFARDMAEEEQEPDHRTAVTVLAMRCEDLLLHLLDSTAAVAA